MKSRGEWTARGVNRPRLPSKTAQTVRRICTADTTGSLTSTVDVTCRRCFSPSRIRTITRVADGSISSAASTPLTKPSLQHPHPRPRSWGTRQPAGMWSTWARDKLFARASGETRESPRQPPYADVPPATSSAAGAAAVSQRHATGGRVTSPATPLAPSRGSSPGTRTRDGAGRLTRRT